MTKSTLLFLIVVVCSGNLFSQADTIHTFEDLMKELHAGNTLWVVIHYQQCRLLINHVDQEKIPDATGGMLIDAWEYFAPEAIHNKLAFVVFSVTKLIRNPLGKGYVYNYVKVRIYSDNSVKITAQYLRPRTMKITMDETFEGIVNDGSNSGGVYIMH